MQEASQTCTYINYICISCLKVMLPVMCIATEAIATYVHTAMYKNLASISKKISF